MAPRDGSGTYTLPFPPVVPVTTIASAVENGTDADIAQDLNAPRPVVAGGTGATSPDSALDNLSAEKFRQSVTNWDSNPWRAGSFYAASSAAGSAPVSGHAFAGICYYANATDLVLEVTDLTVPLTPTKYIRIMIGSVWGNWIALGGSSSGSGGTPVNTYIVNGAMMVRQENATVRLVSGASCFPVDQFVVYNNSAGTVDASQVASFTPGNSPYRLRVFVFIPDATMTGFEFVNIYQYIEGYRMADMKFGTAAAKTFTLQFGCKGPAGTYGVSFHNADTTRNYVAQFNISSGEANTDVIKFVPLPGDIVGNWSIAASTGLSVYWCLMAGPSYQSAAGSWGGVQAYTTSSQFNFAATSSNTFELFDVSLVAGTTAPPFQVPSYAQELAVCQRYYTTDTTQMQSGSTGLYTNIYAFNASMRATPTVTFSGISYTTASGLAALAVSPRSVSFQVQNSAANGSCTFSFAANARM